MTLLEKKKSIVNLFEKQNILSAHIDAELLIAHVLDVPREHVLLHPDEIINDENNEKINELIERRLLFEPIAYILKSREFYSLDFYIDSRVLIPRPETELLVDMTLYYAPQNGCVLDLCTGSGVIAISVKKYRNDLAVFGCDISYDALQVAKKNSNALTDNSVGLIHCHLLESFKEKSFDLIATNPPYVDKKLKGSLQKDLDYEPEIALYAKDRGFEIIEKILAHSSFYLKDKGVLLIELDETIKQDVLTKGKESGFEVSILNDYTNNPRVAVCKKV